jgi:hypothetical protein
MFTLKKYRNVIAYLFGYRLSVFVEHLSLLECGLEDRHEILRMFTLRKGGEHAPIGFMKLYLREERIPQYPKARV